MFADRVVGFERGGELRRAQGDLYRLWGGSALRLVHGGLGLPGRVV